MTSTSTHRERQEIDRANASGAAPVLFVHGMWLLAGSWDRWRALFEARGYATLAPSWPGDPETVEEGRRHPEVFARKRIQEITEHIEHVVRALDRRPAIVGHSLGGLIAQTLAGKGLAAATVAINPAPFRGMLSMPFSAVKAALVVLRNPANYDRAVTLTFDQFRFAFANAIREEEARDLYEAFAVAASGVPIFQIATANLDPSTAAKVDTSRPDRGALLILCGEKDHFIPRAMTRAAYRRQRRNPGVTELREIPDRGHSLTIDAGWREVAEAALAFVERYHPPRERSA